MALGVRGSNPIWTEFDLTGHLFDDTFYLYVLQNTLPYIPATVYHDPDLSLPWTNPIQFLANGTLPIDIFFESDVVYRLEFRQNTGSLPPSQNDALIYEVNDYTAGSGGSTPIDNVAFATSNQITNPQFSLINFSSPLTISATNPDPIEIAPGWTLEVAGTGTATIYLVPLDSSNTNPSNAPYALRLTLSGWTAGSVFLKQRFQQNGMLWADKFVSSTVTARLEGAPQSISASLIDSNASVLGIVLPITPVNELWNEFTGYAEIPATTNPDVPPAAYIEYSLAIPSNIDIYLTSFQLVVQDTALRPSFEQDSIDRQIDHTFHYYKDSILLMPKASILSGWNFGLNPWQFASTSNTALATFGYVADQTIAVQQSYVSSATGNSILIGRAAASQNYGLKVTASASSNQFALIQYVDAKTIRPYWNNILSALVKLSALKQTPSSTLQVKMRLIYRTSVPSTLTQNIPILTWTSGSNPTYSAGWTALTPKNDPIYNLSNGANTLTFEGFNLPASSNDNMTIGIVIYTINNMISTGTPDNIVFNDISLVPNEFAIESNPMTYDQVLKACQFYYENSYSVGSVPAANVGIPATPYLRLQTVNTIGGSHVLAVSPFEIEFQNLKRTTAPTITFYHPDGTINSVEANLYYNGASTANGAVLSNRWSVLARNGKAVSYVPSGVSATLLSNPLIAQPGTGYIQFHYTADARLGLIP
jgi:hypothetical protein